MIRAAKISVTVTGNSCNVTSVVCLFVLSPALINYAKLKLSFLCWFGWFGIGIFFSENDFKVSS